MRGILSLGLLGLTFGCVTAAPVVKADSSGPSPVVARFGQRVIRQAEVDAKVSDELSKLQEQIYELRTEAAERIAIEALVSERAKGLGITEDEWLAKNIEAGLPEPTDGEMKALFERARARLPAGATFDDVKGQLRSVIQRDARSKQARVVFGKLKREGGYTVVLEAPPKQRKPVDAQGPSRGGKDAKVVIVEFADFECPYCARAHETVQAVMRNYGDKVRLVFRHYPLSFHPKAPKAAEATACADEQGKFWAMHDSLFETQELDESSLKAQARQVGLDEARFDDCLRSGRTGAVVKRDLAAGQQAGVSGTPAFFINGIQLSGARPEDEFQQIIDAELARLGVD